MMPLITLPAIGTHVVVTAGRFRRGKQGQVISHHGRLADHVWVSWCAHVQSDLVPFADLDLDLGKAA